MSMLLIEAIGKKPVRLVGKGLNTAIVLKPGEPQEIEAALGAKLLKQCSTSIRVSRSQWMKSWEELASMTESIGDGHPRFQPLQKSLDICDTAFEHDDWATFQRAFGNIRLLMKAVVKPPKPTQGNEDEGSQLKPGDRVIYRTPHIRTALDYDWVESIGTVHLIDEDWQMVLVIPETEEQPWRWMAMCYVTKGTP